MSRALMYVLVLPLLAAEVWAQFVAHDQQFVLLFAVLGLGVLAVRWVLGPTAAETECLPNCPKCRESESLEGDR
jgi:hypothetical protein